MTITLSLRLPNALHAQLRELAQAEDRSLQNYLTRVLDNHVEAMRRLALKQQSLGSRWLLPGPGRESQAQR